MASLSTGTSRIWTDTVDPTSSELGVEQGNFWLNTSDNGLFFLTNDSLESQVWVEITHS